MTRTQPILVTGGAGFIGSNFVLDWLAEEDAGVVNVDALTYAGNLSNLKDANGNARHHFVHGDIANRALMKQVFTEHRPRAVVHFAAESHVDRSVHGPDAFIGTNIEGTFALLEAARAFFATLSASDQASFRFVHISTDEVYGTLAPEAPAFTETTPCAPNSPYAASKAASDMLVRAWHHTYGLPTLTTNCSNNYGPFQFPEKLIPLILSQALAGQPLPLYGDGKQVRDWLHVRDHTAALRRVLQQGRPGETYNIGGNNQKTNLEVVQTLCALLDELAPASPHHPHAQLIRFVTDRPGHDRRYAIDARKVAAELGWHPVYTFEAGLRSTVEWYLANQEWVQAIRTGSYRDWMQRNYAGRAFAPEPAMQAHPGGSGGDL